MKIINLVKTEFIKNYSFIRMILICIVLFISANVLVKISYSEEFDLENKQDFISSEQGNLENNYSGNLSFEEKYSKNSLEKRIKYYNLIKDEKVFMPEDWRFHIINFELYNLESENYILSSIIKDKENTCKINDIKSEELKSSINDYCTKYKLSDLEKLYKENEKKINEYTNLIEENKIYLYLQYQLENNKIKSNDFINNLIDKKVSDVNDYLVKNYYQYNSLLEFIGDGEYSGYRINLKLYCENSKKFLDYRLKRNIAIINYSSKNEIKHDLTFDNQFDGYTHEYHTTKKSVNQVYHMYFIVMLLISITSGGIVSREHRSSTIKNIITTPVRRWKILLSKFIYMILDTYILLIISFIMINICAGIKYGFSDLFTPKLLYEGGKVIEVNYYLYTIKMMFLASIPTICYLSFLLFLSTITLNTSVTIGITSSLSIVSLVVWLFGMKKIIFTPIWYFDCGFMINESYLYLESLRYNYYNINTGIIICLITTVLLYIITNIVYIKRDVK